MIPINFKNKIIMQNSLFVRTEFNHDSIKQCVTINEQFSEEPQSQICEILELKETHIREALIRLGWMPPMEDFINIKKDVLIEILWGICLSDHLGDIWNSIDPLLEALELPVGISDEELLDKMRELDLIPDYQR